MLCLPYDWRGTKHFSGTFCYIWSKEQATIADNNLGYVCEPEADEQALVCICSNIGSLSSVLIRG